MTLWIHQVTREMHWGEWNPETGCFSLTFLGEMKDGHHLFFPLSSWDYWAALEG